jgi:anti-sigma factor ChrR (cupin superfamily)
MTANVMNDTLTGEELALLDRVAAEAIEPMAPPAAVRARILEAVRVTPQFDESVPGEHESRTLRAGEGRWSTLAPGARMKRLSKDLVRKTVTCLLELEPNALAPAHDHEGTEDTFVVRGSCRIGALGLAAGDFHHVEAGAHHGDVVASGDGCVLLITFALEEAA